MSSIDFVRHEADGVVFYTCAALDQIPILRHGFSTRHGGRGPFTDSELNLSHATWDERARVDENRQRFLTTLGMRRDSLVTLSQIHSNRVYIIEESSQQWNRSTQGDALVTGRRDTALAVQVADCFPILLADPDSAVIGAIHAGWRGTLARIAEGTVEAMRRHYACDPKHMIVALGPGIRSCCFEVGTEVVQAFVEEFSGQNVVLPREGVPGKHLLDLREALEIQLLEAGVSAENIFDLGACTRCNGNEFFSYRRDGPNSGRMMGVIAMIQ